MAGAPAVLVATGTGFVPAIPAAVLIDIDPDMVIDPDIDPDPDIDILGIEEPEVAIVVLLAVVGGGTSIVVAPVIALSVAEMGGFVEKTCAETRVRGRERAGNVVRRMAAIDVMEALSMNFEV